jgi:prolyl-tRNA synthetase
VLRVLLLLSRRFLQTHSKTNNEKKEESHDVCEHAEKIQYIVDGVTLNAMMPTKTPIMKNMNAMKSQMMPQTFAKDKKKLCG